MTKVILAINSGSSSIKFSIFSCHKTLGLVDNSSSESLHPATCSRDVGILLNAQHNCTELESYVPRLRDRARALPQPERIQVNLKTAKSSQQTLELLYHGQIESINEAPCLTIFDSKKHPILNNKLRNLGTDAGLDALFTWLEKTTNGMRLNAVGHRVVHGGRYFLKPTLINEAVIQQISQLIPLAPYHQAHNLAAIKLIQSKYPDLPQIACFDTSFHHTQAKLATLFAIPRQLTDEGIIRYGFHGISYEYIASVITQHIGEVGNQRVVVAHLGNGASLCAMYQRQSVATSMGFTALDGLMMGTRCGTIDPGVLLYLLQEKKLSVNEVSALLYQQSGLLGVSGISHDMRQLEASKDPHALEAIELYCYLAAKELSGLCMSLQGCDAIIFTGGIGENSALVRQKISSHLRWLGVILEDSANHHHASIISQHKLSRVVVGVIPTNEEYMIAKHTLSI